jgi:multidrug efflux pump subunit AcrA (membrane-fusion protein)
MKIKMKLRYCEAAFQAEAIQRLIACLKTGLLRRKKRSSQRRNFIFVPYRISILILLISLTACSREEKIREGSHVAMVATNNFSSTLYYAGTIQPINSIVITSPVDGVVVDMPFQYGEAVKAGQLLFQISSAKFLADYKAALMQYIKAKSDFNTNQTLLNEAKFLHKNELISDDDFKMKQSAYYAAQLTLLQAKDVLEVLLHQLNMKELDPYNLTIADADKITKAMHSHMNAENLRMTASAAGIILSPMKSETEQKKIMKGDTVKQGDVLAVIGEMSGINVRIKVNELTVNQLKTGQEIKITGLAFPEETLRGEIVRVDRQGDTSGGGFPLFNVEVSVPKLTSAQQEVIHAGMSAKVQIDIKQDSKIMIPMTAVNEKNGESFVTMYEEQTGKTKEAAVRTGKTTVDSIVVLSGLKAGDKIVVPD